MLSPLSLGADFPALPVIRDFPRASFPMTWHKGSLGSKLDQPNFTDKRPTKTGESSMDHPQLLKMVGERLKFASVLPQNWKNSKGKDQYFQIDMRI